MAGELSQRDGYRLEVEDLGCVRGGRLVLSGLGFRLGAGEGLIVTGPNGAGKSSLLRLIAGLLRPQAGEAALRGGDGELTLAEQCHFLGHLDPVKPSLTVAENLQFWVDFLGPSGTAMLPASPRDDAVVAAALAAVGLGHLADLPGGYLSAGQRRRLSLARLVAVPRVLWLLDEPTAALDAAGQQLFSDLLARHLAGGGMAVAATHLPLGVPNLRELRLGHAAGTETAS